MNKEGIIFIGQHRCRSCKLAAHAQSILKALSKRNLNKKLNLILVILRSPRFYTFSLEKAGVLFSSIQLKNRRLEHS
jgi:hypothetical protein